MDMRCTDCGAQLESAGPCPNCGSNARTINVTLTADVQVHERLDVKGGIPNEDGKLTNSRVRIEARVGSVPSKLTASGRAEIDRRFDRDGRQHDGVPWYEERVVDPETGDVIIDKSHPLADKPPSGSAKPRK